MVIRRCMQRLYTLYLQKQQIVSCNVHAYINIYRLSVGVAIINRYIKIHGWKPRHPKKNSKNVKKVFFYIVVR